MGEPGIAGLEHLEKKISKAADLIAQLRQEKNEVAEFNKELKEKIETLYIRNEELTKELENLKKDKERKINLDKTREEIKNKIEEMLAKLKGIDI